jgi:23S rRNA pseudouridine2604 synthase
LQLQSNVQRRITFSELSMQKRINKFISETGICSRREADRLIELGHVTVNGKNPEMGMQVSEADEIKIKGVLLKSKPEAVYLAFNKPRGITCTTDRTQSDNIVDFLNYSQRVFPIGRLDKDSEGLIFITNDGDIVNKILRSGNNHEKEYEVTVTEIITDDFIKRMGNGVTILDTVTQKCLVEKIAKNKFRIILTQGLNRQIRRMCDALGYTVQKLKRTRIMNITLDNIRLGEWRHFTEAEIRIINQLISESSGTEEASVLHDEVSE